MASPLVASTQAMFPGTRAPMVHQARLQPTLPLGVPQQHQLPRAAAQHNPLNCFGTPIRSFPPTHRPSAITSAELTPVLPHSASCPTDEAYTPMDISQVLMSQVNGFQVPSGMLSLMLDSLASGAVAGVLGGSCHRGTSAAPGTSLAYQVLLGAVVLGCSALVAQGPAAAATVEGAAAAAAAGGAAAAASATDGAGESALQMSYSTLMLPFLTDSNLAFAFIPGGGPSLEGPFWDNVLRFMVYFVTVFTGGLFTLLKPIYDLAKNPVTLILLLLVLGGSFSLMYFTLSAMLGLNDSL